MEIFYARCCGLDVHKYVPGRKTDRKDSEWLAELLRHGIAGRKS